MPAKGWVEINEKYCKACELCVTDCPFGVLALDIQLLSPAGYHPAMMVKPEACTCLLYTSPSPRDRTRSRMPSSA